MCINSHSLCKCNSKLFRYFYENSGVYTQAKLCASFKVCLPLCADETFFLFAISTFLMYIFAMYRNSHCPSSSMHAFQVSIFFSLHAFKFSPRSNSQGKGKKRERERVKNDGYPSNGLLTMPSLFVIYVEETISISYRFWKMRSFNGSVNKLLSQ